MNLIRNCRLLEFINYNLFMGRGGQQELTLDTRMNQTRPRDVLEQKSVLFDIQALKIEDCPYLKDNLFQEGECANFAAALYEFRPDLRVGFHWEELSPHDSEKIADEDGEDWDGENHWQIQHVFLHDDSWAYDSLGVHPMPHFGWDELEINSNHTALLLSGMHSQGIQATATEEIITSGYLEFIDQALKSRPPNQPDYLNPK